MGHGQRWSRLVSTVLLAVAGYGFLIAPAFRHACPAAAVALHAESHGHSHETGPEHGPSGQHVECQCIGTCSHVAPQASAPSGPVVVFAASTDVLLPKCTFVLQHSPFAESGQPFPTGPPASSPT